jgi:hypothetical protein
MHRNGKAGEMVTDVDEDTRRIFFNLQRVVLIDIRAVGQNQGSRCVTSKELGCSENPSKAVCSEMKDSNLRFPR